MRSPRRAHPFHQRTGVRRSRWGRLLLLPLALSGSLGLVGAPAALACTRVLYTAPDGLVITGRSMDWAEDMRSNL